jgi:hypothetical protein
MFFLFLLFSRPEQQSADASRRPGYLASGDEERGGELVG